MSELPAYKHYIETIFSQRSADTVHSLVINEIIGDSKVNFFQDLILAVAKKQKSFLNNHKKPRDAGLKSCNGSSVIVVALPACYSADFPGHPLYFSS